MSNRVTKQMICAKIRKINELLGTPQTIYKECESGSVRDGRGNLIPNVGHITYDYNSIYGGYRLERVCEGGGMANFLRSDRCGAKEFYWMLTAFIEGLQTKK